jgi:5-(carboxyamino)imidazole ribonucleotide mutase
MSVAIIMGSSTDASIMDDAVQTLRSFGVPVEVRVLSAHRTPDATMAFARGRPRPASRSSSPPVPKGIPVATVAVNGARNVALLAVRITALSNERLAAELKRFVQYPADQVRDMDAEIVAHYQVE